MSLHRIDNRGGGTVPERPACHVYVVVGTDERQPASNCFVCGQPLRQHGRHVSSLLAPGDVWAIDETALLPMDGWETTEIRPMVDTLQRAPGTTDWRA